MIRTSRRELAAGAAALGVAAWAGLDLRSSAQTPSPETPGLPKPIAREEYRQRIAKAQALMQKAGIGSLLLEGGSSLQYFTGVRWGRSERFAGVVIPSSAAPVFISPFFEAPRFDELRMIDAEIRTWHEDQNPFATVAGVLKDAKVAKGKLAIEETVRYFIAEGVARAAPALVQVTGNLIVRGCRMIKSATELALMQAANDITMRAYREIHPKVQAGMSQADISAMMSSATRAAGGAVEFSMCLINEASAYPHGTTTTQSVREGSVILMDCGCNVHGYQSDISRTWIFGEPTPKQRKVWHTVKQGQQLALETAKIGTPAGRVDDVVRTFYEKQGYGPGYQTPGLSHRLGHGIGLDGHEPVNLVRGETQTLESGMCFSNEPGLYEFGAFGVRLEDCFHMTESGPKLFSALSPSIDDPFGTG